MTSFGSTLWTSATAESDATAAKAVEFRGGSVLVLAKGFFHPLGGARFWCVRGGSSVSNPSS